MPGLMPGLTVREALTEAMRQLAAAGNDNPRLDARLLLEHALEAGRDSGSDGGAENRLHGHENTPVSAADTARFEAFLRRRLAGEPVSRILGNREFWSLSFDLSPATLDPRPDSETLIDALCALCPDRRQALRILDLGTGSGCLLLAALSEYPQAEGIGVDIDPDSVAMARQNAGKLCLSSRARMICSSWDAGATGPFHIVLSNPPYIPTAAIDGLQPEVRLHDPVRALDGGPDGLDAYRGIAENLPSLLEAGGLALLEFGEGQGEAVATIMTSAELRPAGFRDDLAGIRRCLLVRRR